MTHAVTESIDLPEDDRVFSEKFAHVIADELAAVAKRRSEIIILNDVNLRCDPIGQMLSQKTRDADRI